MNLVLFVALLESWHKRCLTNGKHWFQEQNTYTKPWLYHIRAKGNPCKWKVTHPWCAPGDTAQGWGKSILNLCEQGQGSLSQLGAGSCPLQWAQQSVGRRWLLAGDGTWQGMAPGLHHLSLCALSSRAELCQCSQTGPAPSCMALSPIFGWCGDLTELRIVSAENLIYCHYLEPQS